MATLLSSRPSLETESEMLPQDPPPWVVRAGAWLFIAFFLVALIAAIFVHLPETVSCAFVLAPTDGADPVQSPYAAVVNHVAISEGDTVKQGAELFVLRSEEIRNLDMQFRTLTEDLREREQSLIKADSAFAAQLQIKEEEIAQAESEVKFREKHALTSRELVDRMEKLSKSGGISQVELLRLRLDLAGSEKDQSVAQRTLQQAKLEHERMGMDRGRQRGQDLSEIEKIKFRLASLKSELENAKENLLTLRAPYDAVVISVTQRSPGSVVQNGQELCQLARLDSKPRARLLLAESGLPKLSVGQKVRFFFEAFPYQRYGAVSGTLDWISPSAITSPEGPRFGALASIDPPPAKARTKPLALRVGMRGQARILVGRRTLIEYAFEPVRQLRENARD
ncbi:MAG: HlyD family efflux transporter periplasmic adaptor subunit [Verrucomicrobiota bacterium]|nr:HlyD family efflux transporter periplasmic adaptor subunit [Verrucomicrobiota bacterium]